MSEENIEQVAQPESAPMETPAEVAQGGSGHEFLSMLPEEIRDHPSLHPIKDVENLARSYVNAQRLIGADKLPMPVNPSEEDLDRIYSRLGRPESPDGYQLSVDGNIVTEDVASQFADVAHNLRLTPEQASGIMDYYRSAVENTGVANIQQSQEMQEQAMESLRQEWGRAYDQKIQAAASVAQEFMDTDIFNLTLADGSRLGDNPGFIKAMANVADFKRSVTSEDTVSESAQSNVMTPREAQAEIDSIMNDRKNAYWDKSNPVARQRAIQRVQELMEFVHG